METDLVIVGGGPAGLSAAANAAAEGIETVLLERAPRLGGQAAASSRIENYFGFPNGISGAELARRATRQARRLGADIVTGATVAELAPTDSHVWVCRTGDGRTINAGAVLLTTGAEWRRLGIPGDESAAVRYGAAPDELRAYAGQSVAIVGAANSAGQAALYLAGAGARVHLLARRTLGAAMSAYLVARIVKHPYITVHESAPVAGIADGAHGATVALADGRALDVAAVFVYIGARPAADIAAPFCSRDRTGFVTTAPGGFASDAPGIFVAGDVRAGSRKRVATAAGEGATATAEIWQFLNGK